MCTVLFLPQNDGFTIVSNRDENPNRGNTLPPQIHQSNLGCFIAPIDTLSQGTWVGVKQNKEVFVLLNGGFKNHIKRENYRFSRGKIIWEILQTNQVEVYLKKIDLSGVEPFTLIYKLNDVLGQFVWDGVTKYFETKSIQFPYIWSSSTLYSQYIKKKRAEKFYQFLAKNETIDNWKNLLKFYQTYLSKNNGFIINRSSTLKTVSLSLIKVSEQEINYYYLSNTNLTLSPSVVSLAVI